MARKRNSTTVEATDAAEANGTHEYIDLTNKTFKEQVMALAEAGHTRREIAEMLQAPYNSVQRHLRGRDDVARGHGGTAAKLVEYKGEMMPRAKAIRLMLEEGMSRGEVARALDIPYQIVYRVAKDAGVGGGSGEARPRATVIYNGEERLRAEVIRELAAEGHTRAAIAKQLGVPYQVVYQTLKKGSGAPRGEQVSEAQEEWDSVEEVSEAEEPTDGVSPEPQDTDA